MPNKVNSSPGFWNRIGQTSGSGNPSQGTDNRQSFSNTPRSFNSFTTANDFLPLFGIPQGDFSPSHIIPSNTAANGTNNSLGLTTPLSSGTGRQTLSADSAMTDTDFRQQVDDYISQNIDMDYTKGLLSDTLPDTLFSTGSLSDANTPQEFREARRPFINAVTHLSGFVRQAPPGSNRAKVIESRLAALVTVDKTLDIKSNLVQKLNDFKMLESHKVENFQDFAAAHSRSTSLPQLRLLENQRSQVAKDQYKLLKQAGKCTVLLNNLDSTDSKSKAALDKLKNLSLQYDQLDEKRFQLETSMSESMLLIDSSFLITPPTIATKDTLLNQMASTRLIGANHDLDFQKELVHQARLQLQNTTTGNVQATQREDAALAQIEDKINAIEHANANELSHNNKVDQFITTSPNNPLTQAYMKIDSHHRTLVTTRLKLSNLMISLLIQNTKGTDNANNEDRLDKINQAASLIDNLIQKDNNALMKIEYALNSRDDSVTMEHIQKMIIDNSPGNFNSAG
jgi:hypothetical protein